MVESERFIYRKYEDRDLEFLASMLSNVEMMKFIGEGNPRDIQQAKEFLAWIYGHYHRSDEYGLKLMIRKSDGARVGHAGIVPQQIEGIEELEIGYWIARDYWGKGYASEAAQTFKMRGDEIIKANRLISLIQPANKASRKVAEKIGMALEKEIMLKGKEVCVYVYNK